jgi:mannan endo-1,4-beta-mannosidase
MRHANILFISVIFLQGCCFENKEKNENSTVQQVKNLLTEVSGNNILFGHQDDLAYGIDWKFIPGESDVKRITGNYPAVFGWDLGNIGNKNNIDGVPFDSIRSYIIRVNELGGINTVSWHTCNPLTGLDPWNLTGVNVTAMLPGGEFNTKLLKQLNLVADFFNSLKTKKGELVPVIFRPWHEMYGNWFWWGASTCSNEEFIKLFRYTVNYLRNEKGLKNLLIAFSPDMNFNTKEEYLNRYPGDKFVDILGLDDYSDFKQNRLDMIVIRLGIVSDLAMEKGKIAAFTETGCDKLEIPNWYTSNLLQVLNASEKTRKISYVMVWRNHDKTHFFVPYKGHMQEDDFKNFVNNKLIFLLDDLKY